MIFLGKIKYPITLWMLIKQSIWILYFTHDGDWFSVTNALRTPVMQWGWIHFLESPNISVIERLLTAEVVSLYTLSAMSGYQLWCLRASCECGSVLQLSAPGHWHRNVPHKARVNNIQTFKLSRMRLICGSSLLLLLSTARKTVEGKISSYFEKCWMTVQILKSLKWKQ